MLKKIINNSSKNKKDEYKIETYTLIKGIQLVSENSIMNGKEIIELNQSQFITWNYLRNSETLEDAFSNINEQMNNMISIETFNFVLEELTELGLVYTSSSESDITKYIETECKTVINAELISDIRNKIYLKHLDIEIILSPKEYMLLKVIVNGDYETIDSKDWNIFFSLYKKEAISFI